MVAQDQATKKHNSPAIRTGIRPLLPLLDHTMPDRDKLPKGTIIFLLPRPIHSIESMAYFKDFPIKLMIYANAKARTQLRLYVADSSRSLVRWLHWNEFATGWLIMSAQQITRTLQQFPSTNCPPLQGSHVSHGTNQWWNNYEGNHMPDTNSGLYPNVNRLPGRINHYQSPPPGAHSHWAANSTSNNVNTPQQPTSQRISTPSHMLSSAPNRHSAPATTPAQPPAIAPGLGPAIAPGLGPTLAPAPPPATAPAPPLATTPVAVSASKRKCKVKSTLPPLVTTDSSTSSFNTTVGRKKWHQVSSPEEQLNG
ncbi:hypothetical protein DFH28DRAFT_1117408 [Melampsora americana]|nr:hypothetical protein DFH28DRAFT_1117408 [Melampsora americana]